MAPRERVVMFARVRHRKNNATRSSKAIELCVMTHLSNVVAFGASIDIGSPSGMLPSAVPGMPGRSKLPLASEAVRSP